MIQLSGGTSDTKIQIPFTFFTFAAIALPLAQAFLFFGVSDLTEGVARSLPVLAAAHLYLLGFALMVASGAVYQLTPVVFLTPIRSSLAAYVQAAFLMVGIAGLVTSFFLRFRYILEAGGLILAGILLFIIHLFLMLSKTKGRNVQWGMAIASFTFLGFTVILGLLLGGNLSQGWGLPSLSLLIAHLAAGIGGWFILLIFAFSYKMVPMFSLAHGFSMRTAPWVFLLYGAGVFIIALSPFLRMGGELGMLLSLSGFLLFLFHVRHILKKGLKKHLDPGFRFALSAIWLGVLGHLLLTLLFLFPQLSLLGIPAVLLLIEGFVGFSIMGYLYKIIPFLWWTHRYSRKVGKEMVPTLQEMMFEKEAEFLFPALFYAFFIFVVALAVGLAWLAYFAQGAIFLLTLYFLYLMVQVVRK